MNLEKEIEAAESKFRQALENFFIEKWGDTKLASHDLTHHQRVWSNARSLLYEIQASEPEKIILAADKLLIACYLHDLGMAIDPGERHGIHSSKLVKEFIGLNGLQLSHFTEVIEAVENHDNKKSTVLAADFNLSTLLASADDLDAFSYIGIYRYLEIYLARGIHPQHIGFEIIKNAGKRFANFEVTFKGYRKLIDKQRKRYLILYKFFEGYNREITS